MEMGEKSFYMKINIILQVWMSFLLYKFATAASHIMKKNIVICFFRLVQDNLLKIAFMLQKKEGLKWLHPATWIYC